jgi:hypothetical protein
MAAEEIDYRQVGRDFYAAIRRVRELLHLYESQQWPPAMPEKFDKGLSAMVADPEWRQGLRYRPMLKRNVRRCLRRLACCRLLRIALLVSNAIRMEVTRLIADTCESDAQ